MEEEQVLRQSLYHAYTFTEELWTQIASFQEQTHDLLHHSKILCKPSFGNVEGQPNHLVNTLTQKANPNETIVYELKCGVTCQSGLSHVPILEQQCRQVMELSADHALYVKYITHASCASRFPSPASPSMFKLLSNMELTLML